MSLLVVMSFHGLQEPAILGGDEDDASNDGLVINHDLFLNSKATFPLLRFQMSPFSHHSVFG